MTFKYLAILFVFAFSQVSMAIQTKNCPLKFKYEVKISRVYKTSIYSSVSGWKKAQRTLDSLIGFDLNFSLFSANSEVCFYKDRDGSTATLSTSQFRDPEEHFPVRVDQLKVTIEIDGSVFVSFVPVKSYSRNFIHTYHQPFPVKIKTQLLNSTLNRVTNFDIGMALVELKQN